MNYKEENDNEILSMVCENNEDAKEYLVNKYKNLINFVITKYISTHNLVGLDEKDLYQEGMIGLLSAIDSYVDNKDAKFSTYASRCIENRICTIINRTLNTKNKNLNDSVSLDLVDPTTGQSLYDLIGSSGIIDEMISKENCDELIKFGNENLKGFEKEVFLLKVKDYTNEEIAKKLNEDKRKVENALFRIRTKLRISSDKK